MSILNEESLDILVGRYQNPSCVLFDADGVIYLGDTPLPGAQAVFDYLGEHSIPFCMITNNATRTPAQFAQKLEGMNIAIPESAILTSAVALALYLAEREPKGAPVYVIGEVGLTEPLMKAGFWIDEEKPKYVLVGLDRDLTYRKLKIACLAIRKGAEFIAANPDTTLPTEEGLIPGCGSILSAIQTATGVAPRVIGKPSREIADMALKMLGASRERAFIIGDRLDTDALSGLRAEIGKVLILTGVHTAADIPDFEAAPDLIVSDLLELLRYFQSDEWAIAAIRERSADGLLSRGGQDLIEKAGR